MAAPNELLAEEEVIRRTTTIDSDRLSYEIFSILESKFLFGHDTWAPPPPTNPIPTTGSIKNQRGKVCILSIDGAASLGMRALLPAKSLAYLEQSLKSHSKNPNAKISDFFDLAAGTGAGSLFSSLLFSPTPPPADATCQFLINHRSSLFKPKQSFWSKKSNQMEKAVRKILGQELTLKDTVKPVLIPCYDMLTSAPLVFSRADAVESDSYDFKLWEVVSASWAEPGRAGPVRMRSVDGMRGCVGVDGGLVMSNPTAMAITHVLHNKEEFPFVRGVEDVMVLSLGCGSGLGGGEGGVEVKRRRTRRRKLGKVSGRIAATGAAELVDHAVAMAFGECRSNDYVRIQANGSSMNQCGANLDCDPSSGNVKMMLGAAEEMLKQKNVESAMFVGKRMSEQTNMEKLDWFAGQLVLEHQRRSCRIAPTVAFKKPTTKPN